MRAISRLQCICLAYSLVPGGFVLAQAPIVAHVLDLKGTWHVAGSTPALTRGQGLGSGASIVAASNQPGDNITIVRSQDLSRLQIVCDATAANPCRNPVPVQSSSSAPVAPVSEIATLAHAAFSLLMGSSPATASQYATTMTRSFPAEKLQEDVVALSRDGNLQLPHSPGGIPVGNYTLLVGPVGSDTTSQQNATLSPGGVWQPIPFAAPGLFQISVRDAQDHHIANVMLLVTSSVQVDRKKAEFDEARSHTQMWSGPNARRDEHLFLRAFLQSESNTQ